MSSPSVERRLLHRIKLAGLPDVGPITWQAPRRPRSHGAALHHGAPLYRADGGIFSDETDTPALLLEDPAEARFIQPFSAGGVVVAARTGVRTIPPHLDGFAFFSRGKITHVDGQSCAVSADGRTGVVADIRTKKLVKVDLTTGSTDTLCALQAGMDPLFPPVLDVNHDGTRVLFTDARTQRSDTSLELLDVGSGNQTRLRGPLPEPSHVAASFSPSGARICVTEMLPGDSPDFRLLELVEGREPRTLLQLHHAQPFSQPRFLDEQTVVLLLSPQTHPGANYGPVDVVMLRLDGGIPTPLTKTGDVKGTVRVHGDVISVEGGREVGVMKVRSSGA